MASVWTPLGTPRAELVLSNTLVTGQSFRWRQTGSCYTGVIGQRVVQLRQLPDDVEYRVVARGPEAAGSPQADAAALSDYLQLHSNLQQLCQEWSARDERFARLSPFLPGCRMLRQDPVECLFQFICSSNNHISRIHGMVERLCSTYGTQLLDGSDAREQQQQQLDSGGHSAALPLPQQPQDPQQQQPQQQQQPFYAFPTLEQLSAASEETLRADGFGYRARFIVGSVQQLLAKPGGGAAWLMSLRDRPYAEAHAELCQLPGIGPKVASCICLFSLDKTDAIPVDTHVWNLATRYYAPQLAGKSLTPKLHGTVQQVFVDRFGLFAGWAHNTLFVSQLTSHKQLLPAGLAGTAAAGGGKKAGKRSRSKAAAAGGDSSSSSESDDDGSQAGSQAGSGIGAADAVVTAVLGAAEDRGSSIKQAATTAEAIAAAVDGAAAANGEGRQLPAAGGAAAGRAKRSSRYAAAASSDSGDEGSGAAAGARLVAAFDAAAAGSGL